MEYPTLKVKQKSRQLSDAFRGYNHNMRIRDSEFYDMKNMTSDYYPILAPRKRRGEFQRSVGGVDQWGNPLPITGLLAKDVLCYTMHKYFVIETRTSEKNGMIYFDSAKLDLGLTDGPKELISMGAYVIILPDRKYVNTVKGADGEYEYGDIDASFTTAGNVDITLCTLTGDAYEKVTPSDTAPSNPTNEQLWLDTSTTPHTLKKYSKANGMWVSIATTYLKLEATGIGKNFKQYDGVQISGIEKYPELNGSHALWGCGDDYIIITGMIDSVLSQSGGITVERKMPTMDYIVESNNRLWGCRYGVNAKGEVVNEIYASKLGDFKNWNCFMNLSTDSYVASVGSDGPFTGAITHMGYPLFFKENCVHKVFGNYPANFQIQNTACRGVQQGCHKSLAIVNETLYYKARSAVCAYDGSLPVEMSSELGEIRYSDAVACSHGNKYYITMKADDGVYHLFVYDTAKGMWHKEDNLQVDCFCSFQNELYAIEHEKKNIITMLGSGKVNTEKVPWMVETGLVGMSMPDMKYISKLLVRLSLEVGARVAVSIQYDSMGDWEPVCQMTVTSLRTFPVTIRPRRCDHFRIRIEGEGEGRIYSITKTIEQGSDVS